jgi:hypothetical protein
VPEYFGRGVNSKRSTVQETSSNNNKTQR